MELNKNLLWRWRVSQEEPELLGAAAAFLSILDSIVILDSPMWCSSLTERRILEIHPEWAERLCSTRTEEKDLIFGTKKKIRQIVQNIGDLSEISMMGVVVNCGPALIGEDIEGICRDALPNEIVVSVIDAGGFNGEADQGWQDTMISILKKLMLSDQPKDSHLVNILGAAAFDQNMEAVIHEIEQQIAKENKKIQLIPGWQTMTFKELEKITRAEENIVIHPRGLSIAKLLKEQINQKYVIVKSNFF